MEIEQQTITISQEEYNSLKQHIKELEEKLHSFETSQNNQIQQNNETETKEMKEEINEINENEKNKEIKQNEMKMEIENQNQNNSNININSNELNQLKEQNKTLQLQLISMNKELTLYSTQYNQLFNEVKLMCDDFDKFNHSKHLPNNEKETKKPRQPMKQNSKEQPKDKKKTNQLDDYQDESDTQDEIELSGTRRFREGATNIDVLSTSLLFKNPQRFVFDVHYDTVIEIIHRLISEGEEISKIKGYPSILAVDVFKEYVKARGINLYEGIRGETERKNHLRYHVGSFNKCLRKLEENRVKQGYPECLRYITSCHVYIQYVGNDIKKYSKGDVDF